MKLYKLRHKPSGLFFCPSRHPYKVNLSKTGKVYHCRPTAALRYMEVNGFYHHPNGNRGWNYDVKPFIEEEWEIIELQVEGD